MQNFRFHVRTDVRFGKGQVRALREIISSLGQRILLVYGGGSIKKNGLYDKVIEQLQGFEVVELSGVEPNPKITSVREGVKLCKENKIDVVLAVGGGSTIDAAKVIAGGAYYENDPWDLVTNPEKITKVLPIVTILTLAATGSEMNQNSVISNMETNEKLGTYSHEFIPMASICDPSYLYSLPKYQTAAGTADIMSHIFEQYFQKETGAYIQDRFAEGLLKTCIKYCKIALKEPENYEARANLMWASTMALNGLTGCGKDGAWTAHPIEHEMSAYYDITHGVGLAIVTPRWMRYILNEDTVDKFCEYGINVWGLSKELERFELANKAIDLTEQFFRECEIPMTLSELSIDDSKFKEMARKSVYFGGLKDAYYELNEEDVEKILKACL